MHGACSSLPPRSAGRPLTPARHPVVTDEPNALTAARGVAHDVANVLTVVRTSAVMLREVAGLRHNEDLDAIDQAVDTLTVLVDQLNHLATPIRADESEVFDLAEALVRRRPMLERLLSPQQRLVLEVPDAPIMTRLDATALEQVLVNLVVNGSQAIDGQGTIRVCLRGERNGAILAVEDDGCGMPEAVRLRAMEPFFSTRAGGRGLGLAIVRAALHRSECRLAIASVPGRGTRITVAIPAPRETPPPSAPTPRRSAAPSSELSAATVYIVDDDPLIRAVLTRALAKRVAHVEAFEDGARALSHIEALAPDRQPHVVLTDLAMPRLNGLELARELNDRGFPIPVIMVTAYPPSEAEDLLRGGLLAGLVGKPIKLETLLELVASLLPGRGDDAPSSPGEGAPRSAPGTDGR